MSSFDTTLAMRALALTGKELARAGSHVRVEVLLLGGTAGMLARLLSPARTTADCDVVLLTGAAGWDALAAAAGVAGEQLGLPATWLNRDCEAFAWTLPLGWRERKELVETFGPLVVWRASRRDLIATKMLGAVQRPQDLEDLRQIGPTREELAWVREHLDRLESEHLDGRSFDAERSIVEVLEAATW
jgi:hypothetical protein